MGESSEVAGDPVSWKHFNTSSTLTQVLPSEEEGGGATVWPNILRSGVACRRTYFLWVCVRTIVSRRHMEVYIYTFTYYWQLFGIVIFH
jgi:hypothetical protein